MPLEMSGSVSEQVLGLVPILNQRYRPQNRRYNVMVKEELAVKF